MYHSTIPALMLTMYNFLAKGCVIKVSEDTHHPQRLEIWIKRKPFGGLLENAEIYPSLYKMHFFPFFPFFPFLFFLFFDCHTYEEDICILACPLRTHLMKILKAQLPQNTVFGNAPPPPSYLPPLRSRILIWV
jgi:hypothetical protein